jgi:hypothetical protein
MIQTIEASSARRVISARASPIRRRVLVLRRQSPGENRDEHQIVDAQHDLEGGQRHEARPDLGIGQPIHTHRTSPHSPACATRVQL